MTGLGQAVDCRGTGPGFEAQLPAGGLTSPKSVCVCGCVCVYEIYMYLYSFSSQPGEPFVHQHWCNFVP